MLKSKRIADFIRADFNRIRADEPIPGALHLYFRSNSHIVLWQPAGAILSQALIDKYSGRGVVEIWVHQSDWEPFARYLNGMIELTETPFRQKPPNDPPPPAEIIYETRVSAKDILSLINNHDSSRSERERRALVAKSSRELLGELTAPANLEEQDIVRRAVAKVVQELVDPQGSGGGHEKSACRQIWNIAVRSPELCHGINVSTTAVLFALAFGRIEEDILADIALAGLIHDVGMTLLPYQLSWAQRESLSGGQMHEYLRHADSTPRLLSSIAPEIPERVVELARHHHDCYSREFFSPTSELSQLIIMADTLDSICTGQWDGRERTFADGLKRLEELESDPERRPLVKPEVLVALLRWARGSIPEDILSTASAVVGEQARSVQGGK